MKQKKIDLEELKRLAPKVILGCLQESVQSLTPTGLERMVDGMVAASKQVEAAHQEAERLVGLMKTGDLSDFLDTQPVSGLVVVAVAALIDEGVQEKAAAMLSKTLSDAGKSGAKKRLNADPKQRSKEFVRECWDDWQSGKSAYKSKAAFARDMLKKVETNKEGNPIVEQVSITRWCTAWANDKNTHPSR